MLRNLFRVNTRAFPAWLLVAALLLSSVAPARADEKPAWTTAEFWRASAGAAAGAWAGAKLLGWGPMLAGFSQISRVSPFAALVARPLVPVLAGSIAAQLAKGTQADWALVATQTVSGALGTAAALLIVPGAGALGPWIGEAIGWYGGTWLLKKWRRRVAEREAKSRIAVPSICGPATGAAVAYERWRSLKQAGSELAARHAYSGVVEAIGR